MNKNNNIIIKSKYSDNFILAYNIVKNNFRILHEDYAIINNKYITQFIIKHIKNNNYSLVYKYKNEFHNIPVALIFQNNSSFFHILFHNKLLHSDFINNPQNSFKISFKKPIQKFNNKLYKSIFFIQYKYLKPCQITHNNRKYNIFGYNSDINLKNNDKICTYNKKLMNAWKVKPISSCKHINLSKDNIESKQPNPDQSPEHELYHGNDGKGKAYSDNDKRARRKRVIKRPKKQTPKRGGKGYAYKG